MSHEINFINENEMKDSLLLLELFKYLILKSQFSVYNLYKLCELSFVDDYIQKYILIIRHSTRRRTRNTHIL